VAGPLYDEVYCLRGEAENRIKEQQLGLLADRTSCHDFAANQFRVLLSAFVGAVGMKKGKGLHIAAAIDTGESSYNRPLSGPDSGRWLRTDKASEAQDYQP